MTHQPQDLDTRRIVIAGAVLVGTAALVLLVAFLLWRSWAPPSPSWVQRPPAPRPQRDASHDLASFRRAQRNADHYGWVDREHGIARISVERAMRIMAAEGEETPSP